MYVFDICDKNNVDLFNKYSATLVIVLFAFYYYDNTTTETTWEERVFNLVTCRSQSAAEGCQDRSSCWGVEA